MKQPAVVLMAALVGVGVGAYAILATRSEPARHAMASSPATTVEVVVSTSIATTTTEAEAPLSPPTPAFVVALTNPTDLAAILQDTMRRLAGHNATNADVAAFVAQYHQQEMAAQQGAGRGGVVMRAPDPRAAAESYVRSRYPVDVDNVELGQYVGAFNDLLRNGPNGGGTTTTTTRHWSTSPTTSSFFGE